MSLNRTRDDERGIAADRAFVCDRCGHRWYYARSRCPDCGGDEMSTYALGEGELVAVTTAAVTPPDVRSPNWLGAARFDGVRVVAQLAAEADVGDRVRFEGEYHLRDGDEETNPRLTVLE